MATALPPAKYSKVSRRRSETLILRGSPGGRGSADLSYVGSFAPGTSSFSIAGSSVIPEFNKSYKMCFVQQVGDLALVQTHCRREVR